MHPGDAPIDQYTLTVDVDRLSRPDQFITNEDRTRARRHARIGPIVGGVILVALGLYPGSFVSLPLWASLGMLAVGLVTAVASFDCLHFSRAPLRVTAAMLAALVIAVAASVTYVPTRVAFPLHRAAFEREARSLPPAAAKQDVWIGIYHLQQIWRDADGTVWFQVNRSTALPGAMATGFRYRPSHEGIAPDGDREQSIPLDDSWSIFFRAPSVD